MWKKCKSYPNLAMTIAGEKEPSFMPVARRRVMD